MSKYDTEIVLKWFWEHGLAPFPEWKFDADRKWRFDFAWPEILLALEVEGAVWTYGRHTSGAGFMADMEKYNRATCLGWRILRCVPNDLCTMDTINMVKEAIKN